MNPGLAACCLIGPRTGEFGGGCLVSDWSALRPNVDRLGLGLGVDLDSVY